MRKAAPNKGVKRGLVTTPISFRMPATLRARLRRFAKERGLGEAEALRLVVGDHLGELENERELAIAERWQLKETLATWERFRHGDEVMVSWDEVERDFDQALGPAGRRTKA